MKKVYVTIMVGAISGLSLITMLNANQKKGKEQVWGYPFRGVSICVTPGQKTYELGEDMEISVVARNSGTDEVALVNNGGTLENFRAVLFDVNGQPVARSKTIEDLEAWRTRADNLPVVGSGRSPTRIRPGERSEREELLLLNKWFTIEQGGTYYLVVMRRIGSWEKGFAISNMAKINVAKAEKQQPSP
ncbi:MAG: hypothetical protein ACYST6_10315 [Planctomycetota bacterium]|jgi:hypothetical protein